MNNSWNIRYTKEAEKDLDSLDGSQKRELMKVVRRVAQNPLPRSEGGYGIPLGNKGGRDLTGLFEIKLRGAGLRAIYKLIRIETEMAVIVVGFRKDKEAYEIAAERLNKYDF